MRIGHWVFPVNLLIPCIGLIILIVVLLFYKRLYNINVKVYRSGKFPKHRAFEQRTILICGLSIITVIFIVIAFAIPTIRSRNLNDYHHSSLTEYLADQLDISERKITNNTYSEIINLQIRQEHFDTLNGIEKLTNLENIKFKNVYIDDISALNNAESLVKLYLEDTKITNLNSFENITQLKELILKYKDFMRIDDYVFDLSFIKNNTQLETLKIVDYGTTFSINKDLSSLQDLTNLKSLALNNLGIEDISVLSQLINLEELDLRYNPIRDITPLNSLTNLKTLYIGNNSITNFEPLYTIAENNPNITIHIYGYWSNDNVRDIVQELIGDGVSVHYYEDEVFLNDEIW